MSAVIRRATRADADAIAAIALEAFDETLDTGSQRLANAVSGGINFVALNCDGCALGFVGNFLTRSLAGELRFELDLLAVAGRARGAGLGSALVKASIDAARDTNADVIRALVATQNLAMQKLCDSLGFSRLGSSYDLYVLNLSVGAAGQGALRAKRERSPNQPAKATLLIRVNTLSYSGIWIEGELGRGTIRAAMERGSSEGRGRVGAVIAKPDQAARDNLTDAGFQRIGEYDWWTIRLRSG